MLCHNCLKLELHSISFMTIKRRLQDQFTFWSQFVENEMKKRTFECLSHLDTVCLSSIGWELVDLDNSGVFCFLKSSWNLACYCRNSSGQEYSPDRKRLIPQGGRE